MAAPSYVYDLLASEQLARWNATSAVGTPVTITYKFPTTEPSNISYANFQPMTATEIAAVHSALSYISSFTNITFVETSGTAQIEFGNADLTSLGLGTAGVANYSYDSSGLQHAAVSIANAGPASLADSDFVPGSITANDVGGQGWQTLLHEIGHALGLKHPFDTNISGDPNSILPSSLDDLAHTVMSYTAYEPSNVAVVTGSSGGYSYTYSSLAPSTYSIYDIASLQYLYGTKSAAPGHHVFSFLPGTPVIETIADPGPGNTVDFSAFTSGVSIDMRPGATNALPIVQSLPGGITLPNQYDGSAALTFGYNSLVANCIGGSGSDHILGNSVANVLDGRGGADTMQGGIGNDTYWVDNAGDHAIEANGQGTDTVNSYVSFNMGGSELENLNLRGPASINGTGNSIANVINGNSGVNILIGLGGNDTLDGKEGADTMQGGIGNDTYWVDNAGDHAIEANGQGTDTVNSTVSFNMGGSELENLNLRGPASINGTGNSIANIIVGNSGNNVIDGLGGADTMKGAEGNDTYWVDNAGDHVIEANGQGTDTVNSYVSFNMGGSELENLNLRGPASINGTGNSIANVIVGNSGANVLNGLGGHDTLTGAQGNDTFVFNAPASAANSDVITDFAHVAGNTDTIELENAVYTHLAAGDLNAANLAIGHAALDANDYLVYNPDTGNLAYDADGSGAGGTVLIANLANHAALTAADFFVI